MRRGQGYRIPEGYRILYLGGENRGRGPGSKGPTKPIRAWFGYDLHKASALAELGKAASLKTPGGKAVVRMQLPRQAVSLVTLSC